LASTSGSIPCSPSPPRRYSGDATWLLDTSFCAYGRRLAYYRGHGMGRRLLAKHYATAEFIIPRYNATNEDVPRQFPEILDKLEYLVTHLDAMHLPSDLKKIISPEIRTRVSDGIAWLKDRNALHCNCAGKCGTSSDCPCHVSNEEDEAKRTRTSWCHPGKHLVCHDLVTRT
jgi:hypothetical protein